MPNLRTSGTLICLVRLHAIHLSVAVEAQHAFFVCGVPPDKDAETSSAHTRFGVPRDPLDRGGLSLLSMAFLP